MTKPLKVLILGASYGSLQGTKIALAGHHVRLICLPEEVALFNATGAHVRMPIRGREAPVLLNSAKAPGHLDASGPGEVDPADYDLIALAMQEPQYSAPPVKDLMARVAASGKPVMSIMNMPPLAYLARLPGADVTALRAAYTEPAIWDAFDPARFTLASPDPQAFRPPEEPLNLLQVSLPTNFKVADFEDPAHTALLTRLEADIQAIRFEGAEVPVKLRRHSSLFVPLAKWAMLITGNYRCVTDGAPQAISEAVHSDLALSEEIYNAVNALCVTLGADGGDMVPFAKYAAAAKGLAKPSSAARALDAGMPRIERVDRIVQILADSIGHEIPTLSQTTARVDAKLAANQTKHAA